MVHTTAGYMVTMAYTFKNVFNYEENDIFWCTADIGLLDICIFFMDLY
jgi:acetyl-CoA synthetase